MSLQAKKEGFLRLIGTILIIGGVALSIILDFYVLNKAPTYIFEILTIVLWLFIMVSFKLEIEDIVDNMEKIMMPLLIYSIVVITFGASLSNNSINSIVFIFSTLSSVLSLICWHFSLSIYKKEKKAFLITGIGYIIISLIIRLVIILTLVPFFIFVAGFVLIIYAENSMKKKGLLNYID